MDLKTYSATSRLHWMWWPAIGGVGIGVGGIFFPRGLGVGYDNIAELLGECARDTSAGA